MSDRPLVIVTLEGLATSAISCYGSSWNSTPAIDAIAGGGCVWDRWTATSDQPAVLLRNWVTPTSDLDPLARWKSAGKVELITDDERIAEDEEAGGIASRFDHVHFVAENRERRREPAADLDQTHFGRVVAAAIDRDQRGPWSLLWIHSRVLTHCWDAPRELFPVADEETCQEPSEEIELAVHPDEALAPALETLPALFDQTEPPHLQLDEQRHPDLITCWMRTYGCQVRLVDLLLEVLLESLSVEDPQVVVAGTSGMSLGQNGWIGPAAGPLRSCDLRLPLIVSDRGPIRSPQLTPSDQMAEIISALACSDDPLISPRQWSDEVDSPTRILTASSRARLAITSPRWQLVRDLDGVDHLFLKPDDVEDANDVGKLRPDVVEQMTRPEPTD